MEYVGSDHTFVLCAYKENEHLEYCLESLLNQDVEGEVIISTSTPNEYISKIAEKYNIKVVVNENHEILADDWNFGYEQAQTKLVTVAHQDDFYEPDYRRRVIEAANRANDALIIFTDYYEFKLGKEERSNTLLRIKRIMNAPLKVRLFQRSKFVRKAILAFGCPICCPSVTLIKKNVEHNVYDTTMRNSCDYKTWVKLAKRDGSFVYIPKQLMAHRIYAGSETTKNISENIRQREDLEVLSSLWPRLIAKAIYRVYSLSGKSNKV